MTPLAFFAAIDRDPEQCAAFAPWAVVDAPPEARHKIALIIGRLLDAGIPAPIVREVSLRFAREFDPERPDATMTEAWLDRVAEVRGFEADRVFLDYLDLEGPRSASTIARHLERRKINVLEALRRLERGGHVRRNPDGPRTTWELAQT